jgi:hypothetical protein
VPSSMVVMTDDITALSLLPAGISGQSRLDAIANNAVKAFTAGCDLILTMDARAVSTMIKKMVSVISSDTTGVLMPQLQKSYARVMALRTALMHYNIQ